MGRPAAFAAYVVLVLALNGPPAVAAGGREALVLLDLRVYTYGRMSAADTEETLQVAQTLLGAAGIGMSWRRCGQHADSCGEPSAPNTRTVLVHVVPGTNPKNPSISGDAMPPSSALRMVRVYLPRIAEMVEVLRRMGKGQSLPQLTTLSIGHLVGLTIAHEVGHTLGLRHSREGIMRAQLRVEEVVAARNQTLAFRPRERERMQVTLRSEEGTLASGSSPR